MALKIPADLPIEDAKIPIVIYGGLSAETDTRLKVNAFVDLRSVQSRLPELASGVFYETCKNELALSLRELAADGDTVRARGRVRAKLFSCNRRDPDNEQQGLHWLTQDVDVVASAKATVADQCIHFNLVELELDPLGFLGGIANLFGLANLARSAILEEAEKYFAENAVCPEFPSELTSLSPSFKSGGVREIGDNGIGAALSGSVDTSASTMISLLTLMEQHHLVEGDE